MYHFIWNASVFHNTSLLPSIPLSGYCCDFIFICYINYTSRICCKPYNLGRKAMATLSGTLAGKIPWTEEPGRLQSMGSLWVRHDWATSLSLFTFMHWRRKWKPTPAFLPGESQGRGSLVGCCLWGHRVGHHWRDLAVAAAAAWFCLENNCISRFRSINWTEVNSIVKYHIF